MVSNLDEAGIVKALNSLEGSHDSIVSTSSKFLKTVGSESQRAVQLFAEQFKLVVENTIDKTKVEP